MCNKLGQFALSVFLLLLFCRVCLVYAKRRCMQSQCLPHATGMNPSVWSILLMPSGNIIVNVPSGRG